jgi:hypothetical protein
MQNLEKTKEFQRPFLGRITPKFIREWIIRQFLGNRRIWYPDDPIQHFKNLKNPQNMSISSTACSWLASEAATVNKTAIAWEHICPKYGVWQISIKKIGETNDSIKTETK